MIRYGIPLTLNLIIYFILIFLIGFLPIPFIGSIIFLILCAIFLIPPPLAFFGAVIVFVLNIISFILYVFK